AAGNFSAAARPPLASRGCRRSRPRSGLVSEARCGDPLCRQAFDARDDPVDLRLRIPPPIPAPDPLERPSALLEQRLPSDVAFADAATAVIHGAVAFDRQ